MPSCQNCPEYFVCFKDPNSCERKNGDLARVVCKECSHILTRNKQCPNPDCFYFYFLQNREKTPERLLEVEETKWRNKKW